MRKKHFALVFAIVLAVCYIDCLAKKVQTPMQRIDLLIAKGDTLPASGLHNIFVIQGPTLTPDVIDKGSFTTFDKMSLLPVPDSYGCYTFHHDTTSFIAAKKEYIPMLFQKANKFSLDGENITLEDFQRIPASIIKCVTGEENGQKLSIATLKNYDDPNPIYDALVNAENKWFEHHQEPIPALSNIIIDSLSTFPRDSRFFINNQLCSYNRIKKFEVANKSNIAINYYGGKFYIDADADIPIYFKNADIVKICLKEHPNMTLKNVINTAKYSVGEIFITRDSILLIPHPAKKFIEHSINNQLNKMNESLQ